MMGGRGNSQAELHPSLPTLALYASGDLARFAAWRTGWHVWRCERCNGEVEAFRSANAELKRAAEQQALDETASVLPKADKAKRSPGPHANWKRLEREMTGNIAVGVAAARCIEKIGRKRVPVRRSSLAAIALAALFVAAWLTQTPNRQGRHLLASVEHVFGAASGSATDAGQSAEQVAGTIVETTPRGIAVRTSGASLTILHPASAVVSLARGPGVAASYIDEETGEVTITNVYGH